MSKQEWRRESRRETRWGWSIIVCVCVCVCVCACLCVCVCVCVRVCASLKKDRGEERNDCWIVFYRAFPGRFGCRFINLKARCKPTLRIFWGKQYNTGKESSYSLLFPLLLSSHFQFLWFLLFITLPPSCSAKVSGTVVESVLALFSAIIFHSTLNVVSKVIIPCPPWSSWNWTNQI